MATYHVWHSISCATGQLLKPASPLNANVLAGITTPFSRSYRIEMGPLWGRELTMGE